MELSMKTKSTNIYRKLEMKAKQLQMKIGWI